MSTAFGGSLTLLLLGTALAGHLTIHDPPPIYRAITSLCRKISDALKRFQETTVVVTANTSFSGDIANEFVSHLSSSPYIIASSRSLNTVSRLIATPKYIHVFVDTVRDLQVGLEQSDVYRWNVRARMHFIICVPVENRSWLKPFVRSVWRKKILNFAVSYFYEIFETVDYNPFFDKINNLTSNLGRAFGNKLKNMNGYPLRVGFFADRPRIEQINGEFYGADVSLMRRFVERLNATLQIKQPIEQLLTEDKFLVNLNAVVQEAVDCTFISYFGISKMTTVSSTYPRRMDDIVVLVPYAAVVPQYLYVFMMFPEEVWISIVFSLTAVILCAFICLRYTNRRVGITKLALEHWGAILNVSIKFTNRHVLARYLFLLWSYSCLTLNALFQSLLMTNLITPKYQKNFDTLRDLANSNVRIITHPFHAEMAEGLYPKHLLIERPQYKVLQRIVEGDTSAAYAVQTSIAELLTSRTTAGEHHTYHVLEEHLIPGYNVYLFQKHSPYLDEANDYILLDQQFGLSKFNQNRNCTRKAKKKTRNIAVLSLSHLQSAFYIFFVGIFVSSLALILEVVFHRTKARMN